MVYDDALYNNVAGFGNIVAKNGNNVEAIFDFAESIVRLVARRCCCSLTLLLVWMGLIKVSALGRGVYPPTGHGAFPPKMAGWVPPPIFDYNEPDTRPIVSSLLLYLLLYFSFV